MTFLFALLQGAGVAAALGIRPFAPALVVGLLAAANLGVDYDGTAFAFLESPFVLGALGGATVATVGAATSLRGRSAVRALGAVGVVLAAVSAAGSLDDVSDTWWPAVPVAVACAVLAAVATGSLLERVRGRLDAEAAGPLPFYAEVVAMLAAGLSILFPPLALAVLGLLGWLLLGARRREGEKYAGLRILR